MKRHYMTEDQRTLARRNVAWVLTFLRAMQAKTGRHAPIATLERVLGLLSDMQQESEAEPTSSPLVFTDIKEVS